MSIQGSVLQSMSVVSNLIGGGGETPTNTETNEPVEATKPVEASKPTDFKEHLKSLAADQAAQEALRQRRSEILNQQPVIDIMKGDKNE